MFIVPPDKGNKASGKPLLVLSNGRVCGHSNVNTVTAVNELNLHFGSLWVLPLLLYVCMLKG